MSHVTPLELRSVLAGVAVLFLVVDIVEIHNRDLKMLAHFQ